MESRLKALLRVMRHAEAWRLPLRLVWPSVRSLSTTRPVTLQDRTFLYPNSPPIGSKAFGRYLTGLRRLSGGEPVPLTVPCL